MTKEIFFCHWQVTITVKRTQPRLPNVFLTNHKTSSEQKDKCFYNKQINYWSLSGSVD